MPGCVMAQNISVWEENSGLTEAVRLARGCTGCRTCVDRCPYGLEIPDMLRENIRFYGEFSGQRI